MERYTDDTAEQLTEYAVVLVRAPPGAGKTLVVPETALSWAGAGGKAWAGAGGKAVLFDGADQVRSREARGVFSEV